jgi:DnaA-homolog protein
MLEQLPLQFEFRVNQTFNDFFVGDNQEIISHLQNSVRGEGEQQIFLWGQTGLGKTHLLQACCYMAQNLHRSSFYLDLANPYFPDPSILTGLEDFDLVCLDNIEHIAGQSDWETAIFHFFNQHRDNGHTLIIAADCRPSELTVGLPDLKTRLNWGLTLKIQPLTDTDRINALIVKAKRMGFDVSPRVGLFLLSHYDCDLANLWALLAKLDKASLAAKRKLTVPFLKEILEEID